MNRKVNRLVIVQDREFGFPTVYAWFQNGGFVGVYEHPLEAYWAMAQ